MIVRGESGKWTVEYPPVSSASLAQAAKDAKCTMASFFVPCDQGALKMEIMALMSHDYQKAMDERVWEKMALHWMRALSEFELSVIQEGIQNFINGNVSGKRAKPGMIRSECKAIMSKYNALKFACDKVIDDAENTPDDSGTPENFLDWGEDKKKYVSDVYFKASDHVKSLMLSVLGISEDDLLKLKKEEK